MARSSTSFKKGDKRPEGAGRKKGQQNKATADIKALAQQFGAEAIGRLVELMRSAEFETVQVAACKELLDRGYGKAMQPVQADVQTSVSYELQLLFERTDRQRLRLPTEDERKRMRNGEQEDDLPLLPNGHDLN